MARQSLAPEQSLRPAVLLTRPVAQSQRFAADLQAKLGPLSIIMSSLMAPSFAKVDLEGRQYTGLVLTSETAAEAARRILAAGQCLPNQAFCVGDRTAKAAQNAGLVPVSAKGDAAALIALIQTHAPRGRLLHLRGADTRGDVARTLTEGGIVTESVVAYTQIAQPLSPQAVQVLAENYPLILPLFSPRSAKLLVQALPKGSNAPLWIAAISPATAEAAQDLRPLKTVTASRTDAEAMLQAVADLLSGYATA